MSLSVNSFRFENAFRVLLLSTLLAFPITNIAYANDNAKKIIPILSLLLEDDVIEGPLINVIDGDDLVITGMSTSGAEIVLSVPCINEPVLVDAESNWSCELAAPESVGTVITAIAREDNQPDSKQSSTTVVEITQPPTVEDTNGESILGSCLASGSMVKVFDNQTKAELCTTTVDSNGEFSCEPLSPAPEHGDELGVVCIDPITSKASQPVLVIVDKEAPLAPIIDSVFTSSTVVKGTAEPGADMILTGLMCSNAPITVNALGAWSCEVVGSLVGESVITAVAEDTAGNQSAPASATVLNTCIHTIEVPSAVGSENKTRKSGSWPDSGAEGFEEVDSSGDCISETRFEEGDHYTSYYQFTVTETQTLFMLVAAEDGSETDTYMYLYSGHVTSGDIIDENDNGTHPETGVPIGTDSAITKFGLEPGEYTIEATTSLGSNSGFTESVDGGFSVTLQRF